MITLSAPSEAPETASLLKNPEFADEQALSIKMTHSMAMDGTFYSYISTKGVDERKLTFSFTKVHRAKCLEILAFLDKYAGGRIRLKDHNGVLWTVRLLTEPQELRVLYKMNHDDLVQRREGCDFSLTFKGVKIV